MTGVDWKSEALDHMDRLRAEGYITTRRWWQRMQQSYAASGEFDRRLVTGPLAVEDGDLYQRWPTCTLLRIRANGAKSKDERIVLVREDRQQDSAGVEGLYVYFWLSAHKTWSAGRIGYSGQGQPLARDRVLGELSSNDRRYQRIVAAGGISR